jgi:hypothetical protein
MYFQKEIEKLRKIISFFVGILKVNDENCTIRIQDPNPDPLGRGMDPRIRIRITCPLPQRGPSDFLVTADCHVERRGGAGNWFIKSSTLYALTKLTFGKIQRYTL